MAINFTPPANDDITLLSDNGFVPFSDVERLTGLTPAQAFIEKPKNIPLQKDDVPFSQVLNLAAGSTSPLHSPTLGDIAINSLSVGGDAGVPGVAFINTTQGSAGVSAEGKIIDRIYHEGPHTSQVVGSAIKGDGAISLTINFATRDSGGSPKLTINGLHEIGPEDYAGAGECIGEDYSYENDICHGRAEINQHFIIARHQSAVDGCEARFGPEGLDDEELLTDCINDADDLYEPWNAYENCLGSCIYGTTLKDGSHCYDYRYHIDGGRLPNLWHIGEDGCGCGGEGNEPCNFKFLYYEG